MLQTIPHLLQTCGRVAEAWEWLQGYIFLHLLPPGSIPSEEFLKLQFQVPKNREDEVTWLVGSYLEYMTREAVRQGRVVGAEELRAHLRLKLRTHQMKRLQPLNLQGL